MGAILARLERITRRADDLRPVAASIVAALTEGKRAVVLSGQSPTGQAVPPLKPASMERRRGGGPPRAPRGTDSRILSDYVVQATVGMHSLTFSEHWPGFEDVVNRFETGSRSTPPRPIRGFRAVDVDRARDILAAHILEDP